MTYRPALLALALALLPAAASAADAPPTGGTIAVALKGDSPDDPPPLAFMEGLSDALAAHGFTILEDSGHAAYVAELVVHREDVGTARAKVRPGSAAVIPGAATGTGAGVVIPFSTGASTLVPMRRIRLDLTMHRRGDSAVAWHGAAMTVRSAGARDGTDKRVGADLASALLAPYPAQAPDVVGVP